MSHQLHYDVINLEGNPGQNKTINKEKTENQKARENREELLAFENQKRRKSPFEVIKRKRRIQKKETKKSNLSQINFVFYTIIFYLISTR